MITKRSVKADKLITKASSTFSNAVIQVQKANDLLEIDIQKEAQKISELEVKISDYQKLIQDSLKRNKDNKTKIQNNEQLIKHLKSFTLAE